MMDLLAWYRSLALYNRVANERLYGACAGLPDEEYRRARLVSFGSIHALLNHLMLSDRIWMERFEGNATSTPPLDTVLFDEFGAMREARVREDARIETFFGRAGEGFVTRPVIYVNSKGQRYSDPAPAVVAHFFNHQTHHRGQLHAMLAQAGVQTPSLDMHRILKP